MLWYWKASYSSTILWFLISSIRFLCQFPFLKRCFKYILGVFEKIICRQSLLTCHQNLLCGRETLLRYEYVVLCIMQLITVRIYWQWYIDTSGTIEHYGLWGLYFVLLSKGLNLFHSRRRILQGESYIKKLAEKVRKVIYFVRNVCSAKFCPKFKCPNWGVQNS